jgi:hypothetical protein
VQTAIREGEYTNFLHNEGGHWGFIFLMK